jgi:putative transcriptional regulator
MSSNDAFLTDSSGSAVPESLRGYLLISETELMDPNFHRTVVLIVDHNHEGAFGLVLNRPADAELGEIVEEFEETAAGSAEMFVGGPVEQHYLFTLHSGLPPSATSNYSSSPIEGVVFEPVFSSIESYLLETWPDTVPSARPSFNFYLGYAGWGPGQLEDELEENAWVIIPADSDIVFNDHPEEGWNAALTKKGGLYRIVAQTGFKPSLN